MIATCRESPACYELGINRVVIDLKAIDRDFEHFNRNSTFIHEISHARPYRDISRIKFPLASIKISIYY